MLKRYRLEDQDPGLWDIARIVHEADLEDERRDAPEAPGLDAILRGLSLVAASETTCSLSPMIFDGPYEYRRRATMLGRRSI